MLFSLLFAIVLTGPVGTPTATVSGTIAVPRSIQITKPVQVAIFSGTYVNLYLAEVQKRLDNYWEDYKPAFIQDKTAFLLFRERAERLALETTLARMRRDDPQSAAEFVHSTTNNNFEFHNVPLGECKVVALVTAGNQELVWSESAILTAESPVFVIVKPTTP